MKTKKPEWKTATDPNGRVYYYNRNTRETTWENPYPSSDNQDKVEQPLPALSNTPTNVVHPTATVIQSVPSSTSPRVKLPVKTVEIKKNTHTKPLYKEAIDPVTQRKYWYNRITKQSQWEPPSSEEVTSTRNHEVDNGTSTLLPVVTVLPTESKYDDNTLSNNNLNNTPLVYPTEDSFPLLLPNGWKRVYDSQSQKFYYYHRQSKTVQWEKPTQHTHTAPLITNASSLSTSTNINKDSMITTDDTNIIPSSTMVTAPTDIPMNKFSIVESDNKHDNGLVSSASMESKVMEVLPEANTVSTELSTTVTYPLTTSLVPLPSSDTNIENNDNDNNSSPFNLESALASVRNTRALFQSLSNTLGDTGSSNDTNTKEVINEITATKGIKDTTSNTLLPTIPTTSLPSATDTPVAIITLPVPSSTLTVPDSAVSHRPDLTISTITLPSSSSSSSEITPVISSSLEKPLLFPDNSERNLPDLNSNTNGNNDKVGISVKEPQTPRSPSSTRSTTKYRDEPLVIPKLSKAFMERKKPDLSFVLLEQVAERTYQKHQEQILHTKMNSSSNRSKYTAVESSIQGLLPLSLPGTALSPEAYSLQIGGYLWKKSRKGWKQWLRRFFLTQRWHLLYYEYDNTPADTPLGIFDLRYLTDIRLGNEILSRSTSTVANTDDNINGSVSTKDNNYSYTNSTEAVSSKGKSLKWLPTIGNSVKHSVENDGFDINCYLELRIQKPSVFQFTPSTNNSQTAMLLRAATPYIASEWYEAILDILRRYGCEVTSSSIVYPKIIAKNPVAMHPNGSFSLLDNLPINPSQNKSTTTKVSLRPINGVANRSSPIKTPIIPVLTHPDGHSIQTLSPTTATENHSVQRSPLRIYPPVTSSLTNPKDNNIIDYRSIDENEKPPNTATLDTTLPSIFEEKGDDEMGKEEEEERTMNVPTLPTMLKEDSIPYGNHSERKFSMENISPVTEASITVPSRDIVPYFTEIIRNEPSNIHSMGEDIPGTTTITTVSNNPNSNHATVSAPSLSITTSVPVFNVSLPSQHTTEIDSEHTLDNYTQYLAETRQRMAEMNSLLSRLNSTSAVTTVIPSNNAIPLTTPSPSLTVMNLPETSIPTPNANESIVTFSIINNSSSRLNSPNSTLKRMQSRIRASTMNDTTVQQNSTIDSSTVSSPTTSNSIVAMGRTISTTGSLKNKETLEKIKEVLELFATIITSSMFATGGGNSNLSSMVPDISSERLLNHRAIVTQLSASVLQQYTDKLTISSSSYSSSTVFRDTLESTGLTKAWTTIFSYILVNPSILLLCATQLRSVNRMHSFVDFLTRTVYHPLYSSPLAVLHLLSVVLENLSVSPSLNLHQLPSNNDNIDPRLLFMEELCTQMSYIGHFINPCTSLSSSSSSSSLSPFQLIISNNWDIHVESKLSEEEEPDADEIFILLLLSCFTSSSSLSTLPLEIPLTMYLLHSWKGRDAAIEYCLVYTLFPGIEKHLLKRQANHQQQSHESEYEEFDDEMIRHTMEALANSAGNSHNNPLIDTAINTVFELWYYIAEYLLFHTPFLRKIMQLPVLVKDRVREPVFPSALFTQRFIDLEENVFRSILENRLTTVRSMYLRPIASLSNCILTTNGLDTFMQALKRLCSSSSNIMVKDSFSPIFYSNIITLLDKEPLLDPYIMDTSVTYVTTLSLSMETIKEEKYRLTVLPYITYTDDVNMLDTVKYTVPRLIRTLDEVNISLPTLFTKLIQQSSRSKTVPFYKWITLNRQELNTVYEQLLHQLQDYLLTPVMEEEIIQLFIQLSECKISLEQYIEEYHSQTSRQKFMQTILDEWNPPSLSTETSNDKTGSKSSLSFFSSWNSQKRKDEIKMNNSTLMDTKNQTNFIPSTIFPSSSGNETIPATDSTSIATSKAPTVKNPLMKSLASSIFSQNLWSAMTNSNPVTTNNNKITADAEFTTSKTGLIPAGTTTMNNNYEPTTNGMNNIATLPSTTSYTSKAIAYSFLDLLKQSQGVLPKPTDENSTTTTVPETLVQPLSSIPSSSVGSTGGTKPKSVQLFGDLPNSSNNHDYSLASSISSISSPVSTFSPASKYIFDYRSPTLTSSSMVSSVVLPVPPPSATTTKIRSPFTLYEHGRSDIIQLASPPVSQINPSISTISSNNYPPVVPPPTSGKPYHHLHTTNHPLGLMQSRLLMNNSVDIDNNSSNNVSVTNSSSIPLTITTNNAASAYQRIPPHLRTPARPTTVTAIPRSTVLLSSVKQ